MSIIGKYFLDGREISQSLNTRLTAEAIEFDYSGGFFETLLIGENYDEYLLEKHWNRLLRSIESLSAEWNASFTSQKLDKLKNNFKRQVVIFSKLLEKERAVMRYQLLLNKNPKEPSCSLSNLIEIRKYLIPPDEINLTLSDYCLPRTVNSTGFKRINRYVYQDAIKLYHDQKKYDVIIRDAENSILEGTKTNIFILNENRLITPDLAQGGVAGVMRELVVEAALEQSLNVIISRISDEQLLSADVLFVTNAVVGMLPVYSIFFPGNKRANYVLKTASLAYKNLLKLKTIVSHPNKTNA